jgi:hypothetical protein
MVELFTLSRTYNDNLPARATKGEVTHASRRTPDGFSLRLSL